MKTLYIIGMSGCGKSTLAANLEQLWPDVYHRVVQYTTREQRENETDGKDYHFITKTTFKQYMDDDKFTAKVLKQFPPSYYGTPIDDFDDKKMNVVVASLEGLVDGITEMGLRGSHVLWISDVNVAEAERTARDSNAEALYNEIVLSSMCTLKEFKALHIVKITHEDLKKIRNDKKLLWKFLKSNKLK